MRYSLFIVACALAGAAVWAAGCGSAAARQPIRLHPMAGGPAPDVPMFQIHVVRLQHRLRPDAAEEDIWRLLGTTNVPYEKRLLWEANDLRLGDGAQLAADRMSELVTDTPDRTTQTSDVLVRENMDFVIPVGIGRDRLDIIWTDASGRIMGRHFEQAVAQFRLVCRVDPDTADAVRIALVPEVMSGPEEMHWVRTEVGGVAQRLGRASFVLTDFAAEVRLPPTRLLVLGGRLSSDLSLGGALFYERCGPDVWVQTLIITAVHVKPGPAPQGDSVPFLAPGGVPAKAAAKPATKPPPAGAPKPTAKTGPQPPAGANPSANAPAPPPAETPRK